jgi:hypothetical protein
VITVVWRSLKEVFPQLAWNARTLAWICIYRGGLVILATQLHGATRHACIQDGSFNKEESLDLREQLPVQIGTPVAERQIDFLGKSMVQWVI